MTNLREAIHKLQTRSASNTTDYNLGFNAGLRVAAAYLEELLEIENAREDNVRLSFRPSYCRDVPAFGYCADIPAAPTEGE